MMSLKIALRTLFRTPFVTSVAIVSLALGIGANAALFAIFDTVLLRPLPVIDPARLVNLGAPGPKPGSNSCNEAGSCDEVFSYPMFRDLERAQTVFTGIAAHRGFDANVAYRGQTFNGPGLLVSGSYFPVLGLTPAKKDRTYRGSRTLPMRSPPINQGSVRRNSSAGRAHHS